MPNLLPAHMVLVDALAELAVDEYLAERADEQAPAVSGWARRGVGKV